MRKIMLVSVGTIVFSIILIPSIFSVRKWRGSTVQAIHQEGGGNAHVDSGPYIVERVISSGHMWRAVQDKVKDTVVQIFSQIASLDLLQPQGSPKQATAFGSGFFIRHGDTPYIITNAHVINEAVKAWIQVPSTGKQIYEVDMKKVAISPDRDLALLCLTPDSLNDLRQELGDVPYLTLGDSDLVRRADDVIALGYPLGQPSLKSTTGVVSGFERGFIQISAPINPGSSGGPLLNIKGEVVAINSSGIVEAQNVGYGIPINLLKVVLPNLLKTQLLRRPQLGLLGANGTEELAKYMGNPSPGGFPLVGVLRNSPLEKAGITCGAMIYNIDGYPVDRWGELRVPWSEDKITIVEYVCRLPIGRDVHLTIYQNGVKKEVTVKYETTELPAIREIFPSYEPIDYEVIAGMVVMPLAINHIPLLNKRAPGLDRYLESKNQQEPALIVTHIFPSSQLYKARAMPIGAIICEVNGMRVHTLGELREALRSCVDQEFLLFNVTDNSMQRSDNILVALSWNQVLEEEPQLAHDFRYQMTSLARELLQKKEATPSKVGRGITEKVPMPCVR